MRRTAAVVVGFVACLGLWSPRLDTAAAQEGFARPGTSLPRKAEPDRRARPRQPSADRSTSTSPDLRFWRFLKSDGSCAVYANRVTKKKRTFCDE